MSKRIFLFYFNSFTFYLLIFLFTYTGISKMLDHATFEVTLLQSPLAKNYRTIISWTVPVIELITVGFLLIEKSRRMGLWLSLFLMVVFTFYIGYMILFIPNLPCSCGGILKELSWRNHLLLNGLILISIFISLASLNNYKFFTAINRQSRIPV
ncbi:MAG: MauE/DoxX family redox-associated membrane protein [Ginsengibacter sp.]